MINYLIILDWFQLIRRKKFFFFMKLIKFPSIMSTDERDQSFIIPILTRKSFLVLISRLVIHVLAKYAI